MGVATKLRMPAQREDDRFYYSKLLDLLCQDAPLQPYEDMIADIRSGGLEPAEQERLMAEISKALRLREDMDHKRKRERELTALYETARDLSSLRDTDQVLKAIVQRARQLVGTDIAYLSAADDERGDFYVRATEGVVSQDFGKIRVPRNIGICGNVAASRTPFYSSNYSADDAFDHEEEIDQATRGEGIVSILGIPLEVDSKVIGVLFVGDRYVRAYAPQEMAILSSLGTFAALAIENARLLDETRRSLRLARNANDALRAKAQSIEDAALAHEQLTELIARGGSLENLVQRVSNFLGGKVCVVDDGRKILSGEIVPGLPDEALIKALWESDRLGRSVQALHIDGSTSQVVTIVGGSMRLGALILHREEDLTAAEIRTLERSAIVTGIVLLTSERVAQAAYRNVSETVVGLLRGTSDPFGTGGTKQLPANIEMSWPVTMMLVGLGNESTSAAASAVRTVLTRQDTIYAEYNGDLVVVTKAADSAGLARQISGKLALAFGHPPSIVISAPIAELASIPKQHHGLRRCLSLLKGLHQSGRIVHEQAMAIYALLFKEQSDEALGAFLEHTIGVIVDYDERRKTQLAVTLLAFLDQGRSLQKAADYLGVHVNTIRQRLDTITQLCPEAADPVQSLDLHVALRLRALAETAVA